METKIFPNWKNIKKENLIGDMARKCAIRVEVIKIQKNFTSCFTLEFFLLPYQLIEKENKVVRRS